MGAIPVFFLGWFGAAVLMALLYLVQQRRQEADIVDAGWAASLGLLAVFYARVLNGYPDREILVVAFALCWSIRLTWFLVTKRVMRQGEDPRYAALRARWGADAPRRFFIFFQAQAFLAALLSVPFLLVMSNPVPTLTLTDVIAGMVFVLALGGEVLADIQLAAFRAEPGNKGKVCCSGLWRYTRHPNYFFEWLHWFSYVLLAWNGEYFTLSLISPAIMFYLLFYVTGIPPAEASSVASKGDAYREYQRTTSAFFPWFPKK